MLGCRVIGDTIAVILTVAAFLIGVLFAPPSAHGSCPRGWRLVELQRSGEYTCHRNLVGPENDAREPAGELHGRVYCTGGAVPIIDASNIVGCMRGARW
jgi:hypothetical protein